ncbi:hypothetical protein ED312_10260 [Sinomicrobium pectinilyticum]|uniref:Uncharacterized protein n=1 Tax=Sinomicrobium pectinilyticum TaxID=1084421 RepID=A0A3N0EHI8_SINP1|nr:hypothetical protein [Sinomicrobium pectinilyticum]RNL87187.1 hypothetical protein ED312_10260 [Sinomicrobium pectinilyticum]
MDDKKIIDDRISTKLSDVNNLNVSEIRSHIIVTINQFEYYCSLILLSYFEPKKDKEYDFVKVLLNGSIIGFGGKVKLLRSLSIIDEDEFSRLMQLANIRNGFAHSLHFETLNEDNNMENGEITTKLQHSLEILSNKGEIELKNMKEWFEIFMEKSDYFLYWLPQVYEDYRINGEIRKVNKQDNYRIHK